MQRLLNFLYRLRTFGLFLTLEAICAWLIIVYNNRYNAAFLNSSNTLVASINQLSSNTSDYFKLEQINQRLVEENLLLRSELAGINQSSVFLGRDTSENQYRFFDAKVVNKTFRRPMNYLTLDVGEQDGVIPGMGVISSHGVVGQIKSVSERFSTVTSLLHRNLMISGSIQRTGTLCTVQWDGGSPLEAEVKYVPRHIEIREGDVVTTSGYNAVFPEGIKIGVINKYHLNDNDVFYTARIRLSVDFSSLNYVYLIENKFRDEQDSLELESEVLP